MSNSKAAWKSQYLKKYRELNKEKVRQLNATWRRNNPERASQLQKRYRTSKKAERRAHQLEKLYGPGVPAEPPSCEVCGAPRALMKKGLCADHDHSTGEFRGWLCLFCNAALGYAKDSRDRLQLLINYLDRAELLK